MARDRRRNLRGATRVSLGDNAGSDWVSPVAGAGNDNTISDAFATNQLRCSRVVELR